MSPIAALTGSAAGTAARMSAITDGDGAPSEPSAGFLTSTMSAPAAAAARASTASTTLTSSLTDRSTRAPRLSNVTSSTLPSPPTTCAMRSASARPDASLPTIP